MTEALFPAGAVLVVGGSGGVGQAVCQEFARAGSDVALETADVVLMSDDLSRLPFAVELSRRASAVIRHNLIISLGVSAILVLASIFGWVRISEAVLFHEGSTLLVVANGLRLLAFRG